MQATFPEFIGIGFRRCASSWLHAVLSEHPEISKPRRGLHFFSDDAEYTKGFEWYKKQLNSIKKNGDRNKLLEFSISYAYPEVFNETVERIYSHCPETKIWCVVRNPIDRAYSDYYRSIVHGELNSNIKFEEAIRHNPAYLQRSKYSKILYCYNRKFNKKITIFFYDDILLNAENFLKNFFRYLGVSEDIEMSNHILMKKGSAQPIKHSYIDKSLIFFKKKTEFISNSLHLTNFLNIAKGSRLNVQFRQLNKAKRPPMSDETKKILYNIFKPDIEYLESITNRNLDEWKL